jgi:hypothetical protein
VISFDTSYSGLTRRNFVIRPDIRLPSDTLPESGHAGTHTTRHKETYAVQQKACSLDHLVGADYQRQRHVQAELLGGF